MTPDPHPLPGDGAATTKPISHQPPHLPPPTDPSSPSPDLSIHGGLESRNPRLESERHPISPACTPQMSDRESPHDPLPPAATQAPPSTQSEHESFQTPPPPAATQTPPPNPTPPQSATESLDPSPCKPFLETLLDEADEELVDWGDTESPIHHYYTSTPNAQAEDGGDAGNPMPGSKAKTSIVPLLELMPSAAGSGGSVPATPSETSIRPPPELPSKGDAHTEASAHPKLKLVLVQLACSLAAPAATRRSSKAVWRRVDLTTASPGGSGNGTAPGPKVPSIHSVRGHYCGPGKSSEEQVSSGVNTAQEEPSSPDWQKAKAWPRKRGAAIPPPATGAAPHSRGPPSMARVAFMKRFAGRCFRCLAPDHQVASCRDPIRCISCWKVGHLSRSCPSRRPHTIQESRPRIVPAHLRARLTFPPESIHSRIVFPPLPQRNQPAAAKPDMAYIPDRANRLRLHTGYHPSTFEVADALSVQLEVPRNDIHVRLLRPGEFIAVFQLPQERVPTCSSPVDRHAGAADMEAMERGRSWSRTLSRTARSRDYLCHASDDWERRRSRSPVDQRSTGTTQQQQHLVSYDPLLDMRRVHGNSMYREDDPMVEESLLPWTEALERPDSSLEAPKSPRHMPSNLEEASISADVPNGPASLSHGPDGCDDHGVRGLGAHAFQDPTPRHDFSNSAAEQEMGDMEATGQTAADFCSRMFKEVPAPLLPTPESPPPRATPPRAGKLRKSKTLKATRSSLRQAAKPSAVPVAERAQRKLMRELEFLNPRRPVPDAVTEYIDSCGDELPEEAIKAIRAAARLDDKELAKALAAIAVESDAVEMEVQ